MLKCKSWMSYCERQWEDPAVFATVKVCDEQCLGSGKVQRYRGRGVPCLQVRWVVVGIFLTSAISLWSTLGYVQPSSFISNKKFRSKILRVYLLKERRNFFRFDLFWSYFDGAVPTKW